MAEVRSCDVLVIGSGGAGLQAALGAADAGARVLLATKLGLASSNTAKAQGGIQAAFGEDDDVSIHAADIIKSSHDTANPRLVEILAGPATFDVPAPVTGHLAEIRGREEDRVMPGSVLGLIAADKDDATGPADGLDDGSGEPSDRDGAGPQPRRTPSGGVD